MSAAIISKNFRGARELGNDFAPHRPAKSERMNQRQSRFPGIRMNAIRDLASILGAGN